MIQWQIVGASVVKPIGGFARHDEALVGDGDGIGGNGGNGIDGDSVMKKQMLDLFDGLCFNGITKQRFYAS